MSERNIFEKIFLAGIGALAIGGEKSKELLDEMVRRGEITVEQGKVLNEELRHAAKTALAAEKEQAQKQNIFDQLEQLSDEELRALKQRLDELSTPEGE